MTDKEKEKLEELQADMPELDALTNGISNCITSAESCENLNDFYQNISYALTETNELIKELKRAFKGDKK